jgi:hypothetical protein
MSLKTKHRHGRPEGGSLPIDDCRLSIAGHQHTPRWAFAGPRWVLMSFARHEALPGAFAGRMPIKNVSFLIEQRGDVIENKGSSWGTWTRSGNHYENKDT